MEPNFWNKNYWNQGAQAEQQNPRPGYKPYSLSDLVDRNPSRQNQDVPNYQQPTRSLSELISKQPQQQQAAPRFYEPHQQQTDSGLIYKSDPNSTTEYYSGNDTQSFYAQYMARMGFGNMEGNSLPDDRR